MSIAKCIFSSCKITNVWHLIFLQFRGNFETDNIITIHWYCDKNHMIDMSIAILYFVTEKHIFSIGNII